MRFPRGRRLPAALMAFSLLGMSVCSAQVVDLPKKKEIITKARQSYYNLHTQGMAGYSCQFAPNWNLLLADLYKSDPDLAEKTRKMLTQIQFSVTVDANDKVKIERSLPLTVNEQDLAKYKDYFDGMQQMMEGFFVTATPFLLTSPFPEIESDFQLEDQGAQYLLTHKEKDESDTALMDKNLVLTNLTFIGPDYTATFLPTFFKNPKGFLLSGYDATVKSKNPGADTVLNIRLAYQEAEGLQLIQKLNINGSYGGSSFSFEIIFSDYQITRK
jgi:hypothetical protein